MFDISESELEERRKIKSHKIKNVNELFNKHQHAKKRYGFGYRAERGDIRDYTKELFLKPSNFSNENRRQIAEVFSSKVGIDKLDTANYSKYNFSHKMSPVRDQGELGSCTAFALSAVVEYYNLSKRKVYVPTSPLYTYKKTRDLDHDVGDTGAYLRTTMKQLVTYGWVPENFYPYDISKFDDPISDDLEDMGEFNQALSYIRIDGNESITPSEIVNEIKKYIIKEIPIMCGFTCYESLEQADTNGGLIPFPERNEQTIGGHAIVICGFDDNVVIQNKNGLTSTKGAFIVRSSWSDKWGLNGYGKIPYDYVLKYQMMDFWALLSLEFLNWKTFD